MHGQVLLVDRCGVLVFLQERRREGGRHAGTGPQGERGQALAKRCAELLSQAELKVRQLTGQEIAGFAQQPDEEQS